MTEYIIYLKKIQGIDIGASVISLKRQNAEDRFGEHIADKTISVITGDIRDDLLIFSENRFDYLVHAAGVANPILYMAAPVEVMAVSIDGTRNILEYCRKMKSKGCEPRLLFISSVEVYGETRDISGDVTEEAFGWIDPFQTRSSYAESKRLAETMCKAYNAQYGVDALVARLSKVYGPSNNKKDTRIMAYILNQSAHNEDIVLNSDGSRIFSFCYVTDAVSALTTMLIKGTSGEAYNVSDKNSVASLKQIADLSAEIAGVSVQYAPGGIARLYQKTRSLAARNWRLSVGNQKPALRVGCENNMKAL